MMNVDLALPQLLDCRRLFLRNYEVMMKIGVHDIEKKGEQRVHLNMDLYVPFAVSTPEHDLLEEVVDYNFLRTCVTERIARGHIHLLETLCDDLAKTLLQHPKVRAVRIAAMKPDVFSDCHGVGVEIFRVKE